MLLASSTLQLPTPSMITLSLSALPMCPFLLPLVLTVHPQPCPCHSQPLNNARDPWPPLNEIQLLALTISLLFLSKPPNPSSLILYLYNIIYSSISSSTFPSSLKCSSVLPLHKGGSRACLSNCRSISILPACSNPAGEACEKVGHYAS